MKFLVTGATGFLGRVVVRVARERGHEVRALVRPATLASGVPWDRGRDLEIVGADLRSGAGLAKIVEGVDVVLHLAADKSGDLYSQMGGTVVATENLLRAMHEAGVARIVGISSFSVYDYRSMRGTLDEESPLEARPEDRDAYCATKLLQEDLIRSDDRCRWTILRPGVIFGPKNEWTARIGIKVGEKMWIRTGSNAILPLTYVDNCAEAIVRAAEREDSVGKILNIVDDELPTQRQYCRLLRSLAQPRPRVIAVPWMVMRAIAWAAQMVNRFGFNGGARVPQIFRPASLAARCKPLRYTNAAIKSAIDWSPRIGIEAGLARCARAETYRGSDEAGSTIADDEGRAA